MPFVEHWLYLDMMKCTVCTYKHILLKLNNKQTVGTNEYQHNAVMTGRNLELRTLKDKQ